MAFFGIEIHVNSIEELFNEAKTLRRLVIEKKIVLVRGLTDLSIEQFEKFSSIVAGRESDKENFICWDFGHIMELKVQEGAQNYLFSREKVPFHWDGAFNETPQVLVFNNLLDMDEGRTLFCDTEKIVKELSQSEISLLEEAEIEYKTSKIAHYGGVLIQRIIERHPVTNQRILRIGEEVITSKNPVKRTIKNKEVGKLVKRIEGYLYDSKFCYAHSWKEGDLLLVDNCSLLHGRESFNNSLKNRHLRRIQIR